MKDVKTGRAISIQQPFVEEILVGLKNMNIEAVQPKSGEEFSYMLLFAMAKTLDGRN